MFLNTLLSQLTNKIYTGLFEPPTSGGVFDPNFINTAGREQARQTFKGLLTAPIQTVDQYNVVNQFLSCPGAENRGPNNCAMDTGFAAALSRAEAGDALTVQEAIDAGLLHGDWPLISSNDPARNQDAFCYTYGYCVSNLTKMRIARVVPVGWELAAEKSGQGNIPVTTLQDVVDSFSDCNAENPDALLDANNPWCHLIDPNWVLKYPETQCRAQVYGQTLVAPNADVRNQTCVDTPSCIEEDENGNCVGGFGYCTRERNVWRFNGDACPVQYASCTTLTSRTGEAASYLTTTVDFDGCNADNAGCRWYREAQTFDAGDPADPADDAFEWLNVPPSSVFLNPSSVRDYFDAGATPCPSGDAGCTGLERAAAATFNPVINASFENDADTNGVPDSWVVTFGTPEITTDSEAVAFGSQAVVLGVSDRIQTQNRVSLPPNQFVTVSVFTRQQTGSGNLVTTWANFYNAVGTQLTSATVPPNPVPSINSSDCVSSLSGVLAFGGETDDVYTRSSCTFTTPSVPIWMTVNIQGSGGGEVFVDGVQVDENEVPSTFHVGYGSEREDINLRVAPAYLGCTGAVTDPAECASYARVCLASEVGCTAYTPTNGNPTVPGIVNANDVCPAECVGYETYRQLETNFGGSVFPVYFIASSAESCSIQNAGCSEFTNLDAVTEGGEALAYFSDVRLCQEVGEANATNGGEAIYYTWEGSDAEGFQLRTWTLKESQLSDAPCSSFDAQSGNCIDTGTSSPMGCTQHSDIFTNPDCREFYDAEGDIHFRLYSQTITVSNACSPYRKTTSTVADCSVSGGAWDASSGNCTYNILSGESLTCPAAQNGCRGYTGNTGNNTRIAVQEYFEDGTLANWTDLNGTSLYSNESVATGGHSMQIGKTVQGNQTVGQIQPGYSYIVSLWAKGNAEVDILLQDAAGEGAAFVEDLSLTQGWQEYTFGPMEPGLINAVMDAATAGLTFNKNNALDTAFVDNITLREVQDTAYLIENSWVTPSTCDQTPAGVTAPQYHLGCSEYTTQRGTMANLQSFSAICREEAIGCEGFYDTQNSESSYPQAFNLTCAPVGVTLPVTTPTPCTFQGETVCTLLAGQSSCRFNVDGIDAPFDLNTATAASITQAVEDSVIVPRDTMIYAVDAPQYRCGAEAAGCTLYGAPVFNIDRTLVTAFDDVGLVNDPDTYATTLCKTANLFCEAYSTTDGSTYYFKDPDLQTCEYRTSVSIGGNDFSGWFRMGTDTPCYDSYLQGGTSYGIWRNGDDDYTGWAGTCPAAQNLCSEFVDVVDTADGLSPNGRPYTFLNNEHLDQSEEPANEQCEGKLSQESGCVGFENTSLPYTTFSATASYIKSWHSDIFTNSGEPFEPVDPVDCSVVNGGAFDLDDNGTFETDLCKRFCVYPAVNGYNSGGPTYDLEIGGSCLTNTDCGTITDTFGNDQNGTCLALDGTQTDIGICTGGDNAGTLCSFASECPLGTCENALPLIAAESGPLLARANDANTILKVRRDRSCSEWLACDSQFTAWDQDRGAYVNVCNSVDLCNEFSTLGNQSFCSNWVDEPQRILSEDLYAQRNVSWYGSEYAGYSIPNQYGVQNYQQVNLNPARWCDNGAFPITSGGNNTEFNEASGEWSNGFPVACDVDTDCTAILSSTSCVPADEDFRLSAVLGPCDDDNGTICAVGVCSETGLTCSEDGDCGSAESCVFAPSTTEIGQCFNGICAEAVDGTELIAATRQECRGYPEANAPFPNEVVESWRDPADDDFPLAPPYADHELRPTSFKAGFSRAQTCAKGEQCECSYVTAEYGTGIRKLYYGLDNASESDSGVCSGGPYDGSACLNDTECRIGITTGGTCEFKTAQNTFVGWNGFCIQKDLSINITANQDKNACLLWLPVDQLLGGTVFYNKFTEAGFQIANATYCTETGLFIDVHVTGSSDANNDGIYDQMTPSCAESLRGAYADNLSDTPSASPSFNDPLWIAVEGLIDAAENGAQENPEDSPGSADGACTVGNYDSCWANVFCPVNHFAVLGSCTDDANLCLQSGAPDNDCPYFCVPINSRVTADDSDLGPEGTVCTPPTSDFDPVRVNSQFGTNSIPHPLSLADWNPDEVQTGEQAGPLPVYAYLVEGADFAEYMTRYQSCTLAGVEWDDGVMDTYLDAAWPAGEDIKYLPQWPEDSSQIRDFTNAAEYYLGCSQLAFTSVEEEYADDANVTGNAAYTNRALLSGANEYTLESDHFPPGGLSYATSTLPEIVGQIAPTYEFLPSDQDAINDPTQEDHRPASVAMCGIAGALVTATEAHYSNPSACTVLSDLSAIDARSYDYKAFQLPATAYTPQTCDESSDCDGAPDDDASSGVSCDTANPYACFIGCGAYQLENNPAAASYWDGTWELADGSAFCQAWGLGDCEANTANDPAWCWDADTGIGDCGTDTIDYVCSRYFGHPSSNNPAAGSDNGEIEANATTSPVYDTCDAAAAAGIVPYSSEVAASSSVGTSYGSTFADFTNYQCDGAGAGDNICSLDTDCPNSTGLWCIGGVCTLAGANGVPYTNVLPTEALLLVPAPANQPVLLLRQFFARLYSFWDYADQAESTNADASGRYERGASSPADTDVRDQGDAFGDDANNGNPTPPKVVAVTNVCADNNCVEGAEGAFSVNGDDGRTWLAESSFLANLEFFAYTDPNQYPIRNVIVYWGDGMGTAWADGLPGVTNHTSQVWGRGSTTGSTATDNYYKAHRGLTDSQQQICQPEPGEEEWGKTTESCSEEPFRFQHHYRCTPGLFQWLNATGRTCDYVQGTNTLVNAPCTDGSMCIFQPRVYVRDNWDYCTGVCEGGSDGTGSCFGSVEELYQCRYDVRPVIFDDNPANDPTNSPVENLIENEQIETYWNPWINWDGVIQVSPE